MIMIVKADKEELKNVSSSLIKSSSQVNYEIEVWEKSISELKNIWQGTAADIFYPKIDNYLRKLKMLAETSNSIGQFIGKANKIYIEKDQEFADEIKKENDRYERRINED